jgi:hypothetical protein
LFFCFVVFCNLCSPFCPDAFLGFIPKEDKLGEVKKIREATAILRGEVIPEFAKELNHGILAFY